MISLPIINFSVIYPEIIILVTAIAVLIADLFIKGDRRAPISLIALAGIIMAAFAIHAQWGANVSGFSGAIIVDNYALLFKYIFLVGALLTLFLSVWYLQREELFSGEYFFFILISIVGMMILSSSNELITAFLGLEIMSIPLYLLAGFDKGKLRSNEAALKYLLMGAFASGFLIYGIAFIYGSMGTTNFDEIVRALSSDSLDTDPLILIGISMIVIGFAFKTAFVPFHSWVPDVYTGAPTPVTAFFSIAPKAAGFAILFRLLTVAFSPIFVNLSTMLWVLAVLTMSVGNLIALTQRNIKRMLAYSSIAHAGYILVSLAIGTSKGTEAGLFYLLAYTAMNAGAFGMVILLGHRGEDDLTISSYGGLSRRHPVAAATMSLFMFSLAGIPPTAGFIGKFNIFSNAISAGFIWLAIIGVINSVISVYYYLRVIITMYMKPEADSVTTVTYPPSLLVAIILAAWGTLHIGLFPNGWLLFIRESVVGLYQAL